MIILISHSLIMSHVELLSSVDLVFFLLLKRTRGQEGRRQKSVCVKVDPLRFIS